ncbi:MAG: hypothetical protein J5783_03595 [Lachnospiraceae bacterium]|nr:hypothetical protein [Lachnospiraceae bacterium]
MKRKCKLTIIYFLILVLALMTVSCGRHEEKEEKKPEFRDDAVFAVNGTQVTMGEWNLYACPILDEIDNLYGKDIWNFKMDAEGKLFGEALQEYIRDKIVNVKVVAGKAAELGVRLTEDDRTEISIAASEYMEKLSEEQKKEYNISKELVENVYEDNLLATKVYEYLTLNVDTSTEETEVRHMLLRYIMLPKTYENKSGETVFYSDEEIAARKSRIEAVKAAIDKNPGATLKDFESDDLTVTDLIVDYDGLKERLPEDMAGVVFWLREHEISRILESDEAFFIFECVKLSDEERTKAARIKIIEQREQQVFEEAYVEWKKDVEVINNDPVWKSITDMFNARSDTRS